MAFRFGELNDSSLHAKLVCRSRLFIVASPEYLAIKGTPTQPEQLEQHDLIGFTRPAYINSWPIKVGDEYFLHKQILKLLVVRRYANSRLEAMVLHDYLNLKFGKIFKKDV